MDKLPKVYKGKPLLHAWEYRAKDGAPLGVVARYQNGDDRKEIVPFFNKNGSSWKAGIDMDLRPLFGLEQLNHNSKETVVLIVEGEKSAAVLQNIGLTAITSLGGCKAAEKTDWTSLSGFKIVYLLPDNDEPGEQYMRSVAGILSNLDVPPELKILRLEGLPEKGDIVDWVQSWIDGWDGYQPLPAKFQQPVKEELLNELKRSQPIPEHWNLTLSAGSGAANFDWDEPGVIEQPLKPVPPLPLSIIPEPYQKWIEDISHRMQTPPDFTAISAIVITGSLIGAGCSVRPKQEDTWEVIPNLWGACIGRPSVVLKSPSMKEAMQILEQLQAKAGIQFDEEKLDYEFTAMANKAMLDSIKNQLGKVAKGVGKDGVVNPDDMAKLHNDYRELTHQTEQEPVRKLFKTNETSVQSQTVLQQQNTRGILTFRDELTGLLTRWNRADFEDERTYFLEGWNGNGTYTDFKIGRGLTEASNVCISLLGGIQPDKLKKYLAQTMNGSNDGLIQRFQLAVWPDEPKKWKLVDTQPEIQEKNRVYAIMEALAEMDFVQHGAFQEEQDDRPYFRFSEDAQNIFYNWFTRLQTEKLSKEQNPYMVEHLGKFRSLMPSLALIFHLIEVADGKASGNITNRAVELAVQWCDFLEEHARRIYSVTLTPEREAASILAEHIRVGDLPNPFTIKMVYDKNWQLLKDKTMVIEACSLLVDAWWLMMDRKPVTGKRGRPPAMEYYINPKILQKTAV